MKPSVFGLPIIISEAVAPDEVVMLGAENAVRWTPDSGVEELSEYQRQEIEKALAKARG